MRYGLAFYNANINKRLTELAINAVNRKEMKVSTVDDKAKTGHTTRASKNFWIHEHSVLKPFLDLALEINKAAGWEYDIDTIEPLQYTEYSSEVKGHYGWHADQHSKPYEDGRVRKLSFSVFLNDEYTGGEFDIETGMPSEPNRIKTLCVGKEEKQINETTMQLAVNGSVFFPSHYFHQVRPVESGLRKSLVGWVLGPKYR